MDTIKSIAFASAVSALASPALSQDDPPNVLIIWGDDVGYWNVSAYN